MPQVAPMAAHLLPAKRRGHPELHSSSSPAVPRPIPVSYMRPRVAPVIASPPPGVYDVPFLPVRLSCSTSGCSVLITRDGTVPYVNSDREHGFRCESYDPHDVKRCMVFISGRGVHVLTLVATAQGLVETAPLVLRYKLTLSDGPRTAKGGAPSSSSSLHGDWSHEPQGASPPCRPGTSVGTTRHSPASNTMNGEGIASDDAALVAAGEGGTSRPPRPKSVHSASDKAYAAQLNRIFHRAASTRPMTPVEQARASRGGAPVTLALKDAVSTEDLRTMMRDGKSIVLFEIGKDNSGGVSREPCFRRVVTPSMSVSAPRGSKTSAYLRQQLDAAYFRSSSYRHPMTLQSDALSDVASNAMDYAGNPPLQDAMTSSAGGGRSPYPIPASYQSYGAGALVPVSASQRQRLTPMFAPVRTDDTVDPHHTSSNEEVVTYPTPSVSGSRLGQSSPVRGTGSRAASRRSSPQWARTEAASKPAAAAPPATDPKGGAAMPHAGGADTDDSSYRALCWFDHRFQKALNGLVTNPLDGDLEDGAADQRYLATCAAMVQKQASLGGGANDASGSGAAVGSGTNIRKKSVYSLFPPSSAVLSGSSLTDIASDSRRFVAAIAATTTPGVATTSGWRRLLALVPVRAVATAIGNRSSVTIAELSRLAQLSSTKEQLQLEKQLLADLKLVTGVPHHAQEYQARVDGSLGAGAAVQCPASPLLALLQYITWATRSVPEAILWYAAVFWDAAALVPELLATLQEEQRHQASPPPTHPDSLLAESMRSPPAAASPSGAATPRQVPKLEMWTVLEAYRRTRGNHPDVVGALQGIAGGSIAPPLWDAQGEVGAEALLRRWLESHKIVQASFATMSNPAHPAYAAVLPLVTV